MNRPSRSLVAYFGISLLLLLNLGLLALNLLVPDFPRDYRLWPSWFFVVTAILLVSLVWGVLASGRTSRSLFFLVVLLAAGQTCVSAEEPPGHVVLVEPAKRVTAEEAYEASFRESTQNEDGGYDADALVVDSFAVMEYLYTGGRYRNEPIRFRMRFPSRMEPGKTYPLIVYFHGRGESGDDNERQLAHLQTAMKQLVGPDAADFFMIATQCPKDNPVWSHSISDQGPGDAPIRIAEEIMAAVLRDYPVDEDRISVFGLSSGATAAWEFTARHADRIAALVACSGSPSPSLRAESFTKTVIWAINNRGDAGVPFEVTGNFIRQIQSLGGHAYQKVVNVGGHNTWTKALGENRIFGWMVLQSLSENGPPQEGVSHAVLQSQLELSELFLDSDAQLQSVEQSFHVSSRDAARVMRDKPVRDSQGRHVPHPRLVEAFSVMAYRHTGGRYQDTPMMFRMSSPRSPIPNRKYPLVLWFHDQSESGDDNVRQLAHLEPVLDLLAKRDFYLLAFQCPKDNDRWTRPVPPDMEEELPLVIYGRIMEAVIRDYPVDEDRISLIGLGTGGDALWSFAERHPGRIAAMAPCVSSLPETIPDACLKPATWLFHVNSPITQSGGVSAFPPDQFVQQVNGDGGNVYATRYAPKGDDVWSVPLGEYKAVHWLIRQNRDGTGPPQGLICESRSGMDQFVLFGLPILILGALLILPRLSQKTRRSQ